MILRRHFSTFGRLLSVAALTWPVAAIADPLGISEAVSEALSHSPEVGQADARVGQAEAIKDQAKRDWLPEVTIEATAGLRRLQNSVRNSIGLSALNERPLYAGVSLDQPIFDMGRRQNYIAAQSAHVASVREEREQAAETSAYNAARAYLQVLLYDRLRVDAEENLTFHEKLSDEMREGVARGALSVSERQQADERRQLARVKLADAQRDAQTAHNLFRALIGHEPVGLEMPTNVGAALPPSLDDAVELALKADPRVLSAEHDVDVTEAMIRRTKAEGLPTLDMNASARTGNDFDGYNGKTDDYSALLTLRWRFFDGGVNLARVREANSKAEEARQALAQARRDSEKNARDGWEQILNQRVRFSEQQVHAQVAGDVLLSYRAQFGIGRRSLLDVLDAQNALFSANSDVEIARVSILLSEYALLAQTNQLREYLGVSPRRVSTGPH